MISKKYALLAMVAAVALTLSACGGGGGGPVTDGGNAMREDIDLSNVTPGFNAGAGSLAIAAGQTAVHGDIEFICAAGGADCTVTVKVGAGGTVSATSTGGTVSATNSNAYTARIRPKAVDLSPVTAGFMAGAGTVRVAAGQSVVHGDIAFSCAVGGADCTVTVEVGAGGAVTATSTGGTVSATNSNAYTVRLRPKAVDLSAVPEHGLTAMADPIAIAAGATRTVGNVTFTCPAGGADCSVAVTASADGTIRVASTGGAASVAHSMAYIETPLLKKWRLFDQGSPTLQLSGHEALALYNRVSRRITHAKYGAAYEVDDAGEWRQSDNEIADLAHAATIETINYLPEGVSGQPILEHNDVKMINWNGVIITSEDAPEPLGGEPTTVEIERVIFDSYHGYLEYSRFFVDLSLLCSGPSISSCDEHSWQASSGLDLFSSSLGYYTGTNPTGLGSATWSGVMTGMDVTRYEPGTRHWILGDASIDIDDLSAPDVDVSFTGIRDVAAGTAHPDMTWQDLALTNGAFNDGASATISGLLYGPEQQEVGGVFDRDGITGAFGGALSEGDLVGVGPSPTSRAIESVFDLSDGRTTNISRTGAEISGSGHSLVVQTSPPRYANAVPYHNNANALEFWFSQTSAAEPQHSLIQWQGRSVRGSQMAQTHGLGNRWQVLHGTKNYPEGGMYRANLATDADDSSVLGEPWVGYGVLNPNIVLDDIPALLPGHDWQGVRIPSVGLRGTLDGAQGTFTCRSVSSQCWLELSPPTPSGYYPYGDSVMFTPANGSPTVTLDPTHSRAVATANYLSFGYWLYLPDEASDIQDGEFGVVAGGGDPFEYNLIENLTGTASYAGKAVGMYYIDAAASGPDSGSFEADVALTADFETSTNFGTLGGRVYNFANEPSSFPAELRLETASFFDYWGIFAGGVYGGDSAAPWRGEWGAGLFGNGATPSEHPTGVAGTFGATDGDNGIAGSFAAHKQ